MAEWTIMIYVAGDNDLEGMAPVTLDFGIDTDWDEFLAALSEQPLHL